ncbi:histidine triad nucleotide-binding protein 3-like [Plasmopara halstedii]|uniref:Histidine triad nucleotide-binding protein 3-like n=1 Tax=Plasmopara halstedii TaxID=4781 RepID=A0A0P1AD61_PLAHL|nr:histidine triad nucleotide-binding protein 3-like [Plasmopara halstedii]CEG38702.1 histidine triad nucleotide-binding protein 3-like [Plasmopara halstedii]|eukprot:XP_024575071.1 histidine triad nucleotide-binding protein 3-like [Plasmopara halstedii]
MRGFRSCVFCSNSLREKHQIVYEDAKIIAILDRIPRAKKHVLVIPHEHISYVSDLTPAHCELLKHMMETGKRILASDGFEDEGNCRFGFHLPPFASIPHLHMHCLGLPFLPSWNRLRYMESMLPTYISAESTLAALRSRTIY